MIFNERQYVITKKQIQKFEQVIAELSNKEPPANLNDQLCYQAELDQYNSQLEELIEEVQQYENLKSGNIERLESDDLQNLPEALIKARIVRGLTQEQLAERLGVKPQQVQRDEANKYASASFTKLLEIQRALNIEIREEVIFKK
jgi:ribosome-binding protein aMBF1 (putative translation factor)